MADSGRADVLFRANPEAASGSARIVPAGGRDGSCGEAR